MFMIIIILSVVVHSIMEYFLKCVTILLLVFISFTSAELTEFLWSDDEVSGKYENDNGLLGIKFVCQPGILSIETFSNITIVNFSSFQEVEKRMARSVYMLDGGYLHHKHSIHRHMDRSLSATTKPFNETINDLLHMEEIKLLEGASRAVGKRGVTGKNTPMVLPFHMFALTITRLLDISSQQSTSNVHLLNEQSIISPRNRRQTYDCDKYKEYKNCQGLCGPRCLCLRRVCGDCCFHRACYDHDKCCEKHGYVSSECIILPSAISEQCDEPYDC